MHYQIKRGDEIVATVRPTGQQSKKVMGENLLTMSFNSPNAIQLGINDYVDAFGERYWLKERADWKKWVNRDRKHEYSLKLKSIMYFLDDVNFLARDSNNNLTQARFNIMANAEMLVDLIIANGNRNMQGWTKGTVDETDYQLVSFSNVRCLTALNTAASTFNLEYWFEGQKLHMTKKGDVEQTTLEVGRGKGLYNISRATVQDKKLITRLYCYGGEKNLPLDYRGNSTNVMLPGALPYIEANVDKYGIIEDSITFEEVYPKRVGKVTSVIDKQTFIDADIDFNVDNYKLSEDPVIVFNTGALAGYKFQIASGGFDFATKKFKILTAKNEKDYVLPSEALHPEVGDEYFIENIKMPQSYIDAAELKVSEEGWKHLNQYKEQPVIYTVTGDPLNFQQRNIEIKLGNYMRFIDQDDNLNADIRIIGYTRDLQPEQGLKEPRKYTLELAETNSISTLIASRVSALTLVNNVRNNEKVLTQAKATADGAKRINDYWGVTIDEESGIVATGTVLVGDGAVNNGGMSGVTEEFEDVLNAIRLWFGAAYADRRDAPFRVTNGGKVVMTQADITGTIQALSGKVGSFNILDGLLASNTPHTMPDGSIVYNIVLIGDNVIPAGSFYTAVGRFENRTPNMQAFGGGVNIGLSIRAENADKNYALDLVGGILINGQEGFTGTRGFKIQDEGTGGVERVYNCTFNAGLLLKMEFVS